MASKKEIHLVTAREIVPARLPPRPPKATKPKKTWGPLVVQALMPRFFPTLKAIQHATGFEYSTIHDWSKGNSNPKLDQLERIAKVTGIPVPEMLRGKSMAPSRMTLREHPDWLVALADAKEKYGKRLPAYAFELAGDTSGPLPTHLDADIVFGAAEFWNRCAPDAEIARADTAAANAELAALREKSKRPGT